MGSGNVAPAALMVSAEAAIEPALAKNIIQRICFFMNPHPYKLAGAACAAPLYRDRIKTLEFWHTARQRVADVEVYGVVVRGRRRIRGDEPRRPRQVLILTNQIDSAVARVGPHGLVEAEGAFLNGAVLAVR